MSPKDTSRRLVLAPGFAPQGLQELAARHQWEFLYTLPASTAATDEYVWRLDSQHSFHYFRCVNYPVDYCQVVGPRHGDWLFPLSTELDFLDVEDLLGAFDRATTAEERALTTFALALGAWETPERDIEERLRSRFSDADSQVRLAAIDAAFITAWPDFRADLERLAREDGDPEVKHVATKALFRFDTVAPGEQGTT
jgi:hypothetical protein